MDYCFSGWKFDHDVKNQTRDYKTSLEAVMTITSLIKISFIKE